MRTNRGRPFATEEALSQTFAEDQTRIVFWNDLEREFTETLVELELQGVTTIDLAQLGALEIKIRLEARGP